VGEDGFLLLDRLGSPGAPEELRALPQVDVLRRVWERHFEHRGTAGAVQLRPEGALPPAAEGIESPYDPEARYRSKSGLHWTGYAATLTETCDEDHPHLITHVATTTAAVHEVNSTAAIQQALVGLGLPPGEHLADAGFVAAELLVRSRQEHGIRLVGPPRLDVSWQNRTAGAYGVEDFAIDWERKQVRCPQGKPSARWYEYAEPGRAAYVLARFSASDCRDCPVRSRCTRAATQGRTLRLPLREAYEALREMRSFLASEEGRHLYARRAGIEGTISQGVRSFGLRRARYRGLAKAHLQHVATATAINVSRVSDWLEGVPRATTRVSRLARLAA
jgi:IS5 family transposase